ncbi:DUF305 domain-containing protein [Crossiella sp. CA-258035]|uniref:DUF305 domain-containing protein n=1 Tax=Crossiella sp. CA-258035 TaxID=2981138 RepID=UPI0024BBEC3A|nr:DUF305 domain-containing protein [Crossiella sp. CA-258035]WHT23374.1 DUF305 domain-containing protein [Crossiella sp. CA-258035]
MSEDLRPGRGLRIGLGVALLLAVALLVGAGVLLSRPGGASVPVPAADSVDVGFAQDMSVHHQQAAEMAAIARQRSPEETVRQLAFDIETSQLTQIGRMSGWLSLWNQPELPPGSLMRWMASGAGHGQHGTSNATGTTRMPGMATAEELRRLRSATGREFDVLFLQLMIRHHQGGAPMLEEGAERAGTAQVRNLAQQMLTSQTAEVETMVKMLATRGGQPLPAPV